MANEGLHYMADWGSLPTMKTMPLPHIRGLMPWGGRFHLCLPPLQFGLWRDTQCSIFLSGNMHGDVTGRYWSERNTGLC